VSKLRTDGVSTPGSRLPSDGYGFKAAREEGFISKIEVGGEQADDIYEKMVSDEIRDSFGLERIWFNGVYRSNLFNVLLVQCSAGLFIFTDGFEYGRLVPTDIEKGVELLTQEWRQDEFLGQWREAGETYDPEAEGVEVR
jgi:hypothetical protein